MISNIEITTSLLAFWRHELYASINIIQGYSNLILEELEDQGDLLEYEEMARAVSSIHRSSEAIHQSVSKVLDSKILNDTKHNHSIVSLRHLLEVEISPKIDRINLDVQQLLEDGYTEFNSDLEKIKASNQTLGDLLSKDFNWTDFFSKDIRNHHSVTDSVEKQKKFDQNKSTLNDIEFSLNTIKQDDYIREPERYNAHILIVDNNKSNQELLYRQLEREQYIVDTVESGEKAIQLVESQRYDLILLDIIMPGLNGYQVLRYLKYSQWQNIPVIMISSLNEIDSITKCIEMGAEDYLPKPFNFTLLRARIDACLEKKKLRDQESFFISQLATANKEIAELNNQLKTENIRLSTELEITRRLQKLILPREAELKKIEDVDIVGFMEPAEEVGGDYYDVHQHNGKINISIGDITGHGLESGLLMIMVQTAIRTLIENNETDQKKLLSTLNQVIINNSKRIESERNLSLSLINYSKGKLHISGQHEDIIIVRADGNLERIDTTYLGFPIGLEENIECFIGQIQINLEPGDIMVLYTDGITEAESKDGQQYGIERLCNSVYKNRIHSAKNIKKEIISDLMKHIGGNKILDDLTLVILKQK